MRKLVEPTAGYLYNRKNDVNRNLLDATISHKADPFQREVFEFYNPSGLGNVPEDPVTKGGNTDRDKNTYFAYHIRRGDFQYHDTRLSGEQIFQNTRHLLEKNMY